MGGVRAGLHFSGFFIISIIEFLALENSFCHDLKINVLVREKRGACLSPLSFYMRFHYHFSKKEFFNTATILFFYCFLYLQHNISSQNMHIMSRFGMINKFLHYFTIRHSSRFE